MAPPVEEVLYRRLPLDWLTSRIGGGAAVPLAAIVFAASHVAPGVMVYVVFLGYFVGLLRQWHDSLWPPLVLHAMNNAIATALLAAAR